ncbi:MAG: dihydrofolate reductase, partial [Alphaproteobacteria bacterium]|nr:dihydrofolate reductase [Alphaproteobacteria bacterium]
MMRLTLVVARDRNGTIGKDGALPWRMPSDLKHFKQATMGKPVLMGRRTWESLGRALPGRANIVVTRTPALRAVGAWTFSDLATACAAGAAMAAAGGGEDVCIVGGAALYAEALPIADRLIVTEIDLAVNGGDTTFPAFDESAF